MAVGRGGASLPAEPPLEGSSRSPTKKLSGYRSLTRQAQRMARRTGETQPQSAGFADKRPSNQENRPRKRRPTLKHTASVLFPCHCVIGVVVALFCCFFLARRTLVLCRTLCPLSGCCREKKKWSTKYSCFLMWVSAGGSKRRGGRWRS